MKPVRGGRPARDNKIRGARAVIIGALVQEMARELIFIELFSLNVRNVENVMMKYVRRVSRAREGENCKTRIIQPRWAIEE